MAGRDRRAHARDARIRRRRLLLLLAAAVALGLGVWAGAASNDGSPSRDARREPRAAAPATGSRAAAPRAPVDRLTLARQVGQLLVLRFAGPTVPEYVGRALREQRAAGAILFADNVVAPAQVRALTRGLRDAGGRPLVAVDQEGGDVRIVRWAPPAVSAPRQQAAGSVGADARAAASALRDLGITVSLAPVADVPSIAGAALAGRAFAGDAPTVSAAVADAVRGWRAGGVAAAAKHFPGLGGATVNTDFGPSTVGRSRAQLESTDLAPFAAAIRAGVPLVMVGHARYPALDAARIASQSPPIIDGLLRRRLGFRGVVITDSMEARGSLATGSVTEVSERAVRAGADLLLLTGRGSFTPVYRRLLALARSSPAFRARVRESAARVLALRSTLAG